MEPNNIYIFHQGTTDNMVGKYFLFVFPYSESLSQSDISRFIARELNNIIRRSQLTCNFKDDFWVSDEVLKQGVAQKESKNAIILAFQHSSYIGANVRPVAHLSNGYFTARNNKNIERKMYAMIKYYETVTAEKSPKDVKKRLLARNVFYYDDQRVAGANMFDKRSAEGKALIQAKHVVKSQKLLAQRGYSANAKRRAVNINLSRLEL
ncbi:hypothetical protein GGI00_001540 [Coemansia sp. RSA 2681]|nr:hypothetical protein GGI00_001540 [Coemansia sp. RSA 2681]